MNILKLTAQEIEQLIAVIIFWGVLAVTIFFIGVVIILLRQKTK